MSGSVLHVTNGDSTVRTLAGVAHVGRAVAWRDALHEGPVPALDAEELRRVRARFLATTAPVDAAAVERSLAERDELLAAGAGGEYVLWFEADLYDQLQLVQVLARLGELAVDPARVTLICIGEHVGKAHFGGLGELDAEQLARLRETVATPLTPASFDLARAAWAALTADEPRGLAAIARTRHAELRFVGEAFDRLGREYPSTRDGLSLAERRILAAVAGGAANADAVFATITARELRPFLGDTFCFEAIGRLARARTPLLTVDEGQIRLTDAGRRVLAAEDDHVRVNGVDRWLGGVHLAGDRARWRWDEGLEAVVADQAQPR
jgi:hypothetical protein